MAIRTWNGASAPFNTAANWSSGVTPSSGDTAVINAGTVLLSGLLSANLVINLASSASASPTLALSDAVVAASDRITITSNGTDATLSTANTVVNGGSITLAGSNPVLRVGTSGGSFTNTGTITVAGTGAIVTSGTSSFVNNGTIAFRNAATATQNALVLQQITGSGNLRLSGSVNVSLLAGVGAEGIVTFESGVGGLSLGSFGGFAGSLASAGSNDTIIGTGPRWTNVSFAANGTGGVLTLSSASSPSTNLNFIGDYDDVSDFTVTQDDGTGFTSQSRITTTVAEVAPRFRFTNVTTDTSGTDNGRTYTGPVSYLNYEYLWQGNNNAVMIAEVNNVFLRGGNGDDAIAVRGGSNVVDGAGGSNFLVGSIGAGDGEDTFFVDGRGGEVTWSSIVNFNVGDAVTIFGFTSGVSTLPFTDNEGAAGYTGATIHSELQGAGTGVNGSVTFAGYTVADVQNRFTISSGNVSGIDYLYIKNNG